MWEVSLENLLPAAIGELSTKKELSELGLVEFSFVFEPEDLDFEEILAREPGTQIGGEAPDIVLLQCLP